MSLLNGHQVRANGPDIGPVPYCDEVPGPLRFFVRVPNFPGSNFVTIAFRLFFLMMSIRRRAAGLAMPICKQIN